MADLKITFPKNKKIGVGVSGGADSMALLYLLKKAGADVLAVNFEHGIRGEESKADSAFVAAYCAEHGIELYATTFDAPRESEKSGLSLELTARKLRYSVFNELLEKKVVDYIALAHHADDNAETVLMRILRGTGIRGLRGIVDHDGYIHPLIKYPKKDIVAFCKRHAVPYVTDATNAENDYTRNYIRNVVMAELGKRFDYASGFSRLAENAYEADDYISANALPYEVQGETYLLPIFALQLSHPIIRKYSVAKLLYAMGARQDIEYRHLDYVLSLLEKENGTTINLPFGIGVAREYDNLSFFPLTRCEAFLEDFSLDGKYVYAGRQYTFEKSAKLVRGCSFDAEKVPVGAVIRTRLDGDVFRRCNGRSKKLKDFLIDIKLPARERERLLLLAKGSEVLAVLGVEIGDAIKITGETKETYYIKGENCK